jgi:hypothetical protein
MTEGDGGTRKNVGDEMDEAAEGRGNERKRKAAKETVEKETTTGDSGGVKDNVRDDWRKSQER